MRNTHYTQSLSAFTTFLLMALFISPHAFANNSDKTLEQIAREFIDENGDDVFFTLTVENDVLGAGTDRNYTNGIRLGWFKVSDKPIEFADKLKDLIPFVSKDGVTTVAYSFGQNMYTPDAIESPAQAPNDRPWAGFLYGSTSLITFTDNHIDEFELTLGIVGPLSFAKDVQIWWHDLINTRTPRGWGNQLHNEPGLILSWQRRWPEIFGAYIGDTYLSYGTHLGASVGNVYTYANFGGTLNWSLTGRDLRDKPLSVRPSIPGTGFFQNKQELGVDLFVGAEARAVARNIFLDGNTFSNSHSVDKKHLVADLSTGIAFSYGFGRLSYTLNYRTKEFAGQEKPELFGAVSLGFNF